MPLDMKQAASNMIDGGASDDEIKGVLGHLKQYAGQLIDEGKSDQEVESLVGKSKWKNVEMFKAAPASQPVEQPQTVAPKGGRSEAMLRNPPTSSSGEVLGKVGAFAKKAAIPTALGAAGGALGTLAGPGLGTAIGAGLGGGAGEFINQKLGITEPSLTDIAVSAVAPSALRGAGKALSAAKPLLKNIPGVSAVLKQPVVEEMKNLPAKFLPAESSKSLFAELADLPNAQVKFPRAIAVADELANKEAGLIPGLQSEAIKRGERGAAEKLSSAKPETQQFVSTPGKGVTGMTTQAAKQDVGVSFEVGQDHVRRLGQRIRQAESGITQEDAGSLKRLRSAFIEDMDAATTHLPKLQKANAAFKSEMAVQDLQSMMEGSIKSVAGKSNIYDFNAKQVIDKLNKITSKTNKKDYDKLFTEGIGEKNLKELRTTLDKINDIGPISFSVGSGGGRGGSIVMQTIPAAAGGTIGAAIGGVPGAAVGSITGAMLPGLIAEGLTKPGPRAFILKSFQSSGGKISNPSLFANALGSLLARIPTLVEE